MNLIDALKTQKPLRRPIAKFLGSKKNGYMGNEFIKMLLLNQGYGSSFGVGFVSQPSYLLDETDLLADDWEIQE